MCQYASTCFTRSTSFRTVIQQSHGPTLPASWMVHKAVQVLPHHMPSFQTSRQAVSASSSNCVRDGCTVATSEHRFATWHTVQYKPSKPVCGTHPTQNPQGLTRPRVYGRVSRPRQKVTPSRGAQDGAYWETCTTRLMIPSPTVPWGYSPSAVRYVAGRTHVAGGNAGQWRRQPGCTNDSTARPSSLPGQRARCSANKSRS